MTENLDTTVTEPVTTEQVNTTATEVAPTVEPTKEPEAKVEAAEPQAETVTKFIDSLQDPELKKVACLSTFKDADAIAKAFHNISGLMGKRVDELSADDLKSIDPRLAAPEKFEDYKLEASDYITDEARNEHAKNAHEIGIPKDKFEALFKRSSDMVARDWEKANTDFDLKVKEQDDQLKEDFGVAYDEKFKLAESTVVKYGGEQLWKDIVVNGKASNPGLIKSFAAIGKILSDDTLVQGKGNDAVEYKLTPEEAQVKLEQFRTDNAKALKSFTDPSRGALIKQLHKLVNQAKGLDI